MDKTPKTVNGQTRTTDSDCCCPTCHRRETYRLADGRYKCKHCKKKFSLKRIINQIASEKFQAIVEQFWSMETAEQCAQNLKINRKTAQNYYSRLRNNIAKENARVLAQISTKPLDNAIQSEMNQYPVFWSLTHYGQIRIIFPETHYFSLQEKDLSAAQGVSEVFTSSLAARRDIVLDKFCRKTLWASTEEDKILLQEFWRQTKMNLMRYRGGCKNRFPFFITEMAFRFNHREHEGTIRLLHKMLSGSTSET